MRNAHPHTSGFTLIELLVVISIISMLASVLLASIDQARQKALMARAAEDANTMRTALEEFYDDKGDWPIRYAVTDAPSAQSAWDHLGTILLPYVHIPTPAFPYAYNSVDGGFFTQGYMYYSGGAFTQSAAKIPFWNGVTKAYIGCLTITHGYDLDLVMPFQSSLTLNDGGVDPDGIERMAGDYSFNPATPALSCQ